MDRVTVRKFVGRAAVYLGTAKSLRGKLIGCEDRGEFANDPASIARPSNHHADTPAAVHQRKRQLPTISRKALITAFLLTISLGLGSCYKSATLTYRITVEVDTPEGLRTGSSVWVVESSSGPAFPGPEAGSVSNKIRGEAVSVDLPNGTFFALLRGGETGVNYPAFVVQRSLSKDPRFKPQEGIDWDTRQRNIQKSGISFTLLESEYPVLVRFRDVGDPGTVEQLQPHALDAAFGEGVYLRRITIQMTDEPLTKKIGDRLIWLSHDSEQPLNPNHGLRDFSLSSVLHHGDFKRGS